MKKRSAALVLGTMVCIFMLAACAFKDKAPVTVETGVKEAESTSAETSKEETYQSAGMANPWVDSDREGVFKATGFDMAAPDGASNVAYSYMPDTGMAQMNYTLDNAMWVYRIQPTEKLTDISGIYCEWNSIDEAMVAGMDAVEYSYASEQKGDFIDDVEYIRVINWYDAQKKVTYSLSATGKDLNGLDTAVYAENLYKPAD